MKEIKIFETFAGIGAQTKAFNNVLIKNKLDKKYKIINEGISEWYIDAIIAYSKIHHNEKYYKLLEENKSLTKKELLNKIEYIERKTNKKYIYSSDSKKPINIKKIKEDKLRELYVANIVSRNFGSIIDLKGAELPKDIDIFTYSFPCQAISLQGKQSGLKEDSGTTSSLVWQILRILKEAKEVNNLPKILLMENVKALFTSKFINTWTDIKQILLELGYTTFDTTINAIDKGSIQRRERVFAVSILNYNEDIKKFSFNNLDTKKNNLKIKDILEDKKTINEKYFCNNLKKHIQSNFTEKNSQIKSLVLKDYTKFQSENILYSIDGKSPTITASGANSRIKICDCDNELRYLTPLELWLLMGFDKEDFEQNKELKDITLSRLAGNSISIEILEDLFEDIIKYLSCTTAKN